MAYVQPQAPQVNGVPEWAIKFESDGETVSASYDQVKVDEIKAKLEAVAQAFVPSEEQPVISDFYIVATYNRENAGAEINGDTAAVLLQGVELSSTSIEVDIVG